VDAIMVILSGMRCRFAYGQSDATATHYLLLYTVDQKTGPLLHF